jgi:hypothetical protein
VHAGVVSGDDVHAFPAGVTVLDLVRRGLPAALEAGVAALGGPAVALAYPEVVAGTGAQA